MAFADGGDNSEAQTTCHHHGLELDEEFGIPKTLLDSGIEVYGSRAHVAPHIKEEPMARVRGIRAMEVRDDDIYILAFPKCGTHWIWEITNMLIKKSTSYETRTKENVMIEFNEIPKLNAEPSPRVLNSHLWLNHLPPELVTKKCKIIHLIRNPKDILVSYFHHVRQCAGPNLTFDILLQIFMANRMNLPNYLEYLRHMSEFEKSHPGYPVQHIHYEEMKRNPVKTIQGLAEFLQVTATESFYEEVAQACSFDKMKQIDKDKKEPEQFAKLMEKTAGGKMQIYRKGVIGDWKNNFTVAQNEVYDDFLAKEKAKGLDFDFIFE